MRHLGVPHLFFLSSPPASRSGPRHLSSGTRPCTLLLQVFIRLQLDVFAESTKTPFCLMIDLRIRHILGLADDTYAKKLGEKGLYARPEAREGPAESNPCRRIRLGL